MATVYKAGMEIIVGSVFPVTIESILSDLLVVCLNHDEKVFRGVLLDSTKRNLHYGIGFTHFNQKLDSSKSKNDDKSTVSENVQVSALSLRHTYSKDINSTDERLLPKKYCARPIRDKNVRNNMRLRPRHMLCTKCKQGIHETSVDVNPKINNLEKPDSEKTIVDTNSKIDIDINSKIDIDKNSKIDIDKNSKIDIDKNSKIDIDKNSKIDIDKNPKIDIDKNPKIDIDKNSKIDIDNLDDCNKLQNNPELNIISDNVSYSSFGDGIKITSNINANSRIETRSEKKRRSNDEIEENIETPSLKTKKTISNSPTGIMSQKTYTSKIIQSKSTCKLKNVSDQPIIKKSESLPVLKITIPKIGNSKSIVFDKGEYSIKSSKKKKVIFRKTKAKKSIGVSNNKINDVSYENIKRAFQRALLKEETKNLSNNMQMESNVLKNSKLKKIYKSKLSSNGVKLNVNAEYRQKVNVSDEYSKENGVIENDYDSKTSLTNGHSDHCHIVENYHISNAYDLTTIFKTSNPIDSSCKSFNKANEFVLVDNVTTTNDIFQTEYATECYLIDGRTIHTGDVVWGKILGFPWWPGRVKSIEINHHDNGSVVNQMAQVAWYGRSTVSSMPCNDLYPFLEDYALRYNKKKHGAYKVAIKQATIVAESVAKGMDVDLSLYLDDSL